MGVADPATAPRVSYVMARGQGDGLPATARAFRGSR